ncbi:endonuclease domain-containing protein [Agromyces sp. SYSU K20354]|uniref:endonuclease domain-containing protein n=1 Tax=Agromyces cavernae TaxID=2898659 RepID=UPI001E64DDD2|nr:endonuclease domain-containing protein [Agromyces cavernae]MCD2443509.1 endonuclease domain-containing protein [Agromyces cavernae]
MRPHLPLPNGFAQRAFTTYEALAEGVGAGRLRGRDLTRPFHGVRSAAALLDLEARCRAKMLTMRPGQVFSHATACRLFGIVVPSSHEVDELDVAAFAPRPMPRGRGVRGHRLGAGGTCVGTWRGLPIVSPEDAWCQLAATATVRDLVVAGDSLLRRHEPLSTPKRLRAAVERHAGRRGHRVLVTALAAVRAGTDSPEETRLRLDLVEYGLPEPIVNLPIFDESGRLCAYGDTAYPEYKVLAEYDGEHHRTEDRQYARDVDRLDDLARLGWRVIRFTKRHRGRARTLHLDRVRQALIARGWPGAAS